MPIYEYKCNDCNEVFEILSTSAKDNKKVVCTKCGSENVTKLISAGSPVSLTPAGCGGNSGFS
ncbi:FmdB family zinc ribbon protein [Desulforhopalus sp. 52FAK]